MLVLSDSSSALLGLKQGARNGHGRTKDLVEVVDEVGRRTRMGLSVHFGWVKAHVGIRGNERADLMAKAGCRESILPQVMKGGMCVMWKNRRSEERAKSRLGMSRVVCWNRRAVLRYMDLRVGKGDLGRWRRVLGAGE